MCEEFARMHHIFASVTYVFFFLDFTRYEFFKNMMLICVKNTFEFVTGVTNTFLFVTSVKVTLFQAHTSVECGYYLTSIDPYTCIRSPILHSCPAGLPCPVLPCPTLFCPVVSCHDLLAQHSPAQPSQSHSNLAQSCSALPYLTN